MWGIQNPGQTKILLLDNLHLKQINRRSCLPKNLQHSTWNPSTRAPVGSKEWTFHPCPGGVNTSWETSIWISPPRSFILMWNVSSKQPKKMEALLSDLVLSKEAKSLKWHVSCVKLSKLQFPHQSDGFKTSWFGGGLRFCLITSQCTKACASWISPERNGFDGLNDQEKQLPSLLFDSDRSMLLLFPKQIIQSSYERALAYPTSFFPSNFLNCYSWFRWQLILTRQLLWASNTKHASNGQAQQDQQHHQMDLVCIALLALQGLNESKNLVREGK